MADGFLLTRPISDTFNLSENNMVSPLFAATCLNGCFIRMVNIDFRGDNQKTPCLRGAASTWIRVSSPTSCQFGDGQKKVDFQNFLNSAVSRGIHLIQKTLRKNLVLSKSHKIRAIWRNGVCTMHLLKSEAFFFFYIFLIIKQHLFAPSNAAGAFSFSSMESQPQYQRDPLLCFSAALFRGDWTVASNSAADIQRWGGGAYYSAGVPPLGSAFHQCSCLRKVLF